MRWDCHECGEPHSELPDACRTCGTKPEVVKNDWKCPTCGHQGNDGLKIRCENCGADKDAKAQTAVAPDKKVEGERGLALARGDWKSCGFCNIQVPPIDDKGRPAENCPNCAGPLDVAAKEAAEEVVSGPAARTYADQRLRFIGEPSQSAAPPMHARLRAEASSPDTPPQRSGMRIPWSPVLGVALTLAVALGVWAAWGHFSRDVSCEVAGRSWERSIYLQKQDLQPRSGWRDSMPAKAPGTCSPKWHHDNQVPAGVTYTTEEDPSTCASEGTRVVAVQVRTGSRCGGTGYVKKGGVSVKTCTGGQVPVYETRQKTESYCKRRGTRRVPHTVFASIPVYADYCYWQEFVWVYSRSVVLTGSSDPRWPVPNTLPTERERSRDEKYAVILQCPDSGSGPLTYTLGSQATWDVFQVGVKTIAHLLGGSVTDLRLGAQ